MDTTAARIFLRFSSEKLTQSAGRIDDCLLCLNEDQIWMRGSESENAIGNLVLHLCGNLGQWIGAGVAGRPDTRNRDAEFAARGGAGKEELRERLRETVRDTVAVIDSLPVERLTEPLQIQKYHVTVLEAIYHVVEHFAQHTGQILFATKLMLHEDLGYYRHLQTPAPHNEKTP
jgi:uncharacterized damage-inducible protein DinB